MHVVDKATKSELSNDSYISDYQVRWNTSMI